MIDFINVSIAFGGRPVLERVSFRIGAGERVGVVGSNGAGKSTLFGLATGECMPDSGTVETARGLRISHLHQQLRPHRATTTLLEYAAHAPAEIRRLQHEIAALEEGLPRSAGTERTRIMSRIGDLQTRFEHLGGYALEARAKAALGGLGFGSDAFERPFASFSGGWQMRAELARALAAEPDLLLLDEPTNYLDIPAVEWLQRFLREFRGTLLLISHDRYLLNTLTTVTLEVAAGRITRYPGNYERYVADCRQRHEQLEAAWKNQERRREQIERFVERFRAKNTKSAQVQSRIKMLEKMEEIAIPRVTMRAPRIRAPIPPPCGAEVMRLEQAGVTYDGQHWVLRDLDLRIARGERLGLVGLNGMGKTTLLRVLAGRLPLNAGRRVVGHQVAVGYQSQDFGEQLDERQTVLATARAMAPDTPERAIRALLGGFFFSGDAVEKTVGVLSGGEKMRLAFACLLLRPPNFLLLDEPTTHLDIPAREALEQALRDYTGTIVLVSHDIEFTRHVATGILAMIPGGVRRFAGDYDYYRTKLAEESSGAGAAGGTPTQNDNRKAQRRERARQRQELSSLRKPLETKQRHAEQKVAALEREQAELTEALSQSEVSDKITNYAKINRRLHEIQAEIAAWTAEWEEAGLALEAIGIR